VRGGGEICGIVGMGENVLDSIRNFRVVGRVRERGSIDKKEVTFEFQAMERTEFGKDFL